MPKVRSSYNIVINECQTRLDTENVQLWREAGLLLSDDGFVLPSNTAESGLPEHGVMKEDLISNALIWLSSRLCNYIAAGEGFNPVIARRTRSMTCQETLASRKSLCCKSGHPYGINLMSGTRVFLQLFDPVRGSSRISVGLSGMSDFFLLGTMTILSMRFGIAFRCVELLCSTITWHGSSCSLTSLMRLLLVEPRSGLV